jgi:hypothetical protein
MSPGEFTVLMGALDYCYGYFISDNGGCQYCKKKTPPAWYKVSIINSCHACGNYMTFKKQPYHGET